jgi:hypothetical protein
MGSDICGAGFLLLGLPLCGDGCRAGACVTASTLTRHRRINDGGGEPTIKPVPAGSSRPFASCPQCSIGHSSKHSTTGANCTTAEKNRRQRLCGVVRDINWLPTSGANIVQAFCFSGPVIGSRTLSPESLAPFHFPRLHACWGRKNSRDSREGLACTNTSSPSYMRGGKSQ